VAESDNASVANRQADCIKSFVLVFKIRVSNYLTVHAKINE